MEMLDYFVSGDGVSRWPTETPASPASVFLSLCFVVVVVLDPVLWLPTSATVDSCEQTYNSANGLSGNFSSPGYPSPYPLYSACRYFFTGTQDERIRITFYEFVLEPPRDAGCLSDYIDIFTIDGELTKNLENRICGGKIPAPFVSIHNRVELVFKSDYTGSEKGFFGHYEFLDENWQPYPESSPGCGPTFRTGLGGEITSPEYPNAFPPNVQCTWTVRVDHQKTIVLNFIDLKLSKSAHCESTFVSIYNGFSSPTSAPAEKICNSHARREFRSKSYRIIIRFQSGSKVVDKSIGFRIAWTAVWAPREIVNKDGSITEDHCEGFYCSGGEYCIDTSRLLCNPLQHYCISQTLRCNQIPNCGAYDNSDEEGCFSRTLLLVSVCLSVASAVLVLSSAVLCFRRRRRRRRQRRRRRSSSSGSFRADKPSPSPASPTGPDHQGFTRTGSLLRRPSAESSFERSPSTAKRPGSLSPAVGTHLAVVDNAAKAPFRTRPQEGFKNTVNGTALSSFRGTPYLLRRQQMEILMYLMRDQQQQQQDSNFVVPDAGVNIPTGYPDERRVWDWSGEGHWRPTRCSRSRSSDGVHRLSGVEPGGAYLRNALDPLHLDCSYSAAAAHVVVPARRSRYLSIGTLSTKPLTDYRFCLSSETLSRKVNAISSVV